MKIFETERLLIKSLEATDQNNFIELLSDPRIITPIPQPKLLESQILERFHKNLNIKLSTLKNEKCVCGIFEKGNPEMIGLSLFLINDDNEKELGYRFRVNYWGKGYATETTKGMLNYYFNELNIDKVTADVNTENTASVKILNKFMKPVREFFNERDNCIDRRYEIEKNNWLERR
ncbi:GNAT family N-acetyltransferase [Xanthomarina sp.]|uniref:GNAT family N-acetyltransferase n=1 Tax=Xanthomarina sp. TaxID=1931211 RepID=UPI002C1BE137|nr:GNAT family N-acetyltransferase [Xanthomarina sp.]HLV38138.1 GNAT family N-acetyltransferase [Xanthomarina sp.]